MAIDHKSDTAKGLALGPILFVVAILAVLIGALMMGSNSPHSANSEESRRIQATTLIQQGTTIKSAMDRLLVNGHDALNIVVAPTYTAAAEERALYAPQGGDLAPQMPPSDTVADQAGWAFIRAANLPGIGSTGANDFLTIIEIRNETNCKALNAVIFGRSALQAVTVPTAVPAAPATVQVESGSDGVTPASNTADLSAIPGLSGRTQACYSDGASPRRFYYYQVLSAG